MNFLQEISGDKTLRATAFILGIAVSIVVIYNFSLQAILNKIKLDELNR